MLCVGKCGDSGQLWECMRHHGGQLWVGACGVGPGWWDHDWVASEQGGDHVVCDQVVVCGCTLWVGSAGEK